MSEIFKELVIVRKANCNLLNIVFCFVNFFLGNYKLLYYLKQLFKDCFLFLAGWLVQLVHLAIEIPLNLQCLLLSLTACPVLFPGYDCSMDESTGESLAGGKRGLLFIRKQDTSFKLLESKLEKMKQLRTFHPSNSLLFFAWNSLLNRLRWELIPSTHYIFRSYHLRLMAIGMCLGSGDIIPAASERSMKTDWLLWDLLWPHGLVVDSVGPRGVESEDSYQLSLSFDSLWSFQGVFQLYSELDSSLTAAEIFLASHLSVAPRAICWDLALLCTIFLFISSFFPHQRFVASFFKT